MSKWSSQCRDVRWQKKRLEIMERDEFTCQSCGKNKNVTLNVHHIYYEKGLKPWEYESDLLITWCENCHKIRHQQQKEALIMFSKSGIQEISDCIWMLDTMHENIHSIAGIPFKGQAGLDILKKIEEVCK